MSARVLLIEDDAKSVDLVKLILGSKGYETVVAGNGLRGLKMAREEPPDLILLDLMLPGVDGFEVLHQIRSDPKIADVPVVITSAKTQLTDRKTAAKLGVDAYLTKPYRKAKLLDLVETLMQKDRDEERAGGVCVTLVGPRGGEATSVALHLGLALAKRDIPTAMIDLRPFSVEHTLLLDMSPRSTPLSLSDSETREQLHDLTSQHVSGLRLLNNLEGSGGGGQLTSSDIDVVLNALLSREDVVLVEMPLYPTSELRQVSKRCALLLLVTRSDQASLAAARSVIAMMEQAGLTDRESALVLTDVGAEEQLPDLGQPVMGAIPPDASFDDPAFQALADHLQGLRPS